jgi:hypothetical protein
MKCLVSIFFAFFTFQVSAQTYLSLNLDTSAIWVHEFSKYSGASGGPITCYAEFTTIVEKDTTIGAYIYHKLLTYLSDDMGAFSGPTCFAVVPKNDRITFIREDSSSKKVYKIWPNGVDSVVLDFGLSSGDTLELGLNTLNPVIDSVTINTILGVARECRWGNIPMGGGIYRTIEGVGASSNFPIIDYGEWLIPVYNLKCYKKNGMILYQRDITDSCQKKPKIIVSVNDVDKNGLKLNMTNQQFLIENPEADDVTFSIISIDGKIIVSHSFNDSFKSIPSSQMLCSGIYIVSIQTKSKNIQRKVFID